MTERTEPTLTATFSRIAIFGLIGGLVGLLVGLGLMVLFDGKWVDNPFWAASAGIIVGSVAAPLPRNTR